ncbi:hypothetical protein HYP71_gp074 [Arthrobacter phage KBurrousTX]|uniref:Uncharacterized protein n=1 Tax=Arthrobacter phage KBurrousTX TaxID=2315608 RepID=A0A386K898_9CAUD|nr:hypothetical protein HYP71_gp074 [Arthrobacter phage KBurrousTX]AYD81568.1 hypothetical protein KBurrousTX_74 [Arthrobacter phage KBurrousTX]
MPRIELVKDHRGHIVGHVATVTKEEQEEADRRAAALRESQTESDFEEWIDW